MDYENNPFYLRPGESQNDYFSRNQRRNNQPVGGIFNTIRDRETDSDRMQNRRFEDSQRLSTDPSFYRGQFISMFQDRINALNQVYDQQLSKARIAGQGRVGSGTAVLNRRGLVGSPRGQAIQENIVDANTGFEESIQARRNAEVGAVEGLVSQMAVEEARAKSLSKEQGADAYLEHLKTVEVRKSGYLDQNIESVMSQGLDINNVADSIAKGLGVQKEQVLLKYQDAVAAQKNAIFEREGEELKRGKTSAEIDKINADILLADKKFNEDKKQFGLEYALKAKEQSFKELAVRGKNNTTDSSIVIANTQDKINTINGFLKIDTNGNVMGLSKAGQKTVGPNRWARLSFGEDFTNLKGDFSASINQLTSQLTLDKLVEAKASGATFGSLTDGERITLSGAATKLNSYAIRLDNKPDGKIIGYKSTEKQFADELAKIRDLAQRDLSRRTRNSFSSDESSQLDQEFGNESSYFE